MTDDLGLIPGVDGQQRIGRASLDFSPVELGREHLELDAGVAHDLIEQRQDKFSAGLVAGRVAVAAQLWERWGTSAKRGLLPPLFDVQVLRITPRGLLLRGFQVSTRNGPGTTQYAQEWWAVPIDKP